MKPLSFTILMIICLLAHVSVSAQFFYPKKCTHPDSVFTELRPGTLNIWASGGFRKSRSDGEPRRNWFSAVTINYIPLRFLETGVRFNKPVPHNEPYSYQHSIEYIPYARYTLLANGCYRYAFWGEMNYHFDRRRTKNNEIGRTNSPAAGFGVYKTLGRFLWIESHAEFFLGEKIMRQEFKLVWKIMNVRFGKTRQMNLNVPLPTF